MIKRFNIENAPKPKEIIKLIKNERGNEQIIGMDISNSEDCSASTSICGNCKNVIESKSVKDYENEIPLLIYKRCPHCGVKFTRHIINE